MLRPYGCRRCSPDDGVDVVGHDDELVEADGWEAAGEVSPGVGNDLADQAVVEQQFAAVSADRDEVGAGVGVVVCGEADGVAIVEVGVVAHGNDDMRSAMGCRGVNDTLFGPASSRVGRISKGGMSQD